MFFFCQKVNNLEMQGQEAGEREREREREREKESVREREGEIKSDTD